MCADQLDCDEGLICKDSSYIPEFNLETGISTDLMCVDEAEGESAP